MSEGDRTTNDRQDRLEITLVTSNYPFEGHPNVGTFVAALAETWARQGDSVTVIAPLPIWSAQTKKLVWRHPSSSGPGKPTVFRPSYISYSNKRFGPFSTQAWTVQSFYRAVERASQRLARTPDLIYAHFLFPAGRAGAALAKRLDRPAVVALGESSFDQAEQIGGPTYVTQTLQDFAGILSVSRENASIVIERFGANQDRVEVIPNAVDTNRFQPHDRLAARREFGLPEDAVILTFAGYFIERKGALRVLEAMKQVDGLYGVFLGDGPEVPCGDRVLHAGPVAHEDVARWLSASDFFVLPTQAEGSPNAVIEAMACGLPIVSSDIASVRETVDDESALLVDPMDIDALADAMRKLMQDPQLRESMGAAALARGQRTSLDERAERIRTWLSQIVERGREIT